MPDWEQMADMEDKDNAAFVAEMRDTKPTLVCHMAVLVISENNLARLCDLAERGMVSVPMTDFTVWEGNPDANVMPQQGETTEAELRTATRLNSRWMDEATNAKIAQERAEAALAEARADLAECRECNRQANDRLAEARALAEQRDIEITAEWQRAQLADQQRDKAQALASEALANMVFSYTDDETGEEYRMCNGCGASAYAEDDDGVVIPLDHDATCLLATDAAQAALGRREKEQAEVERLREALQEYRAGVEAWYERWATVPVPKKSQYLNLEEWTADMVTWAKMGAGASGELQVLEAKVDALLATQQEPAL